MIRFLNNSEIDRQKWDLCIDNACNSLVYGYSWYLDAICNEWNAIVAGDYEIVFPVPTRKKFFLKYAYQPFFAQQLGLFSKNPLYVDRVQNILNQIPKSYSWIDINLNSLCPFDHQRFISRKNNNFILDLNKEYGLLEDAYSENCQRNLEEARQLELKITSKVNLDAIIQLFRNDKGKAVRAYKNTDYQRLHKLMETIQLNGKAEQLAVLDQKNELLAAAFFIVSHQRAIFLFSGNSKKGRENKAMFYLLDHFIRTHAGMAMSLDFEGSNLPGLARFYGGFGAKKVSYYTFYSKRMSTPIRILFDFYLKFR